MAAALSDQEVTRILHYLLSRQIEAEANIEVLRAILEQARIVVDSEAYDEAVASASHRIKEETEGLTDWMQRISALRLPELMADLRKPKPGSPQS